MGLKRCPDCDTEKPLDSFYRNRRNRDGRNTYCRPCAADRDRRRYPASKSRRRSTYLKQTYNLTDTQWADLFDSQGRVCAICGEHPKQPVVDHCHKTGAVRGILCSTCNRSIGMFKDDVDVLISAASYLIQHEDVLSTVGGE